MFRLGGRLMLQSGAVAFVVSAVAVAVSVCVLLAAIMKWRRAPLSQSVLVAVVLALPGLFADTAYTLDFSPITGLEPITAGPFAALIIFGNASLLAYALLRQSQALVA